jgi:chromosome segregation ATPase
MKSCFAIALLVALAAGGSAADPSPNSNPLSKVIQLMDELLAKLTADGVAEDKAYHSYFEWCDETTQTQRFEIKTAKAKVEELTAAIEKAAADIETATAEIDDLAGKIAKAKTELKDATEIRKKEEKEFLKSEATLEESLSALTRAIEIISKEMAKNPAAFMQVDTSSMAGLISALSAVVDSAGMRAADVKTLTAFVQSQQQTDDDDDAPDGAPAAAAYKSHSGGIVETLEDLKSKAEAELAGLRKDESNSAQNYNLLKGSLEAEIGQNTKEKKETEAFKAETEEQKARDTADLAATTKLLEETEAALASTQDECMKVAASHDESVVSRKQEMKAVHEAKKILMETSKGAAEETYSFVQLSSLRTSSDLKGAEVVRFVKALAKKQHSQALSQLASKISALVQFGRRNGADPFTKVIGLIKDMIAKLEAEAEAAAKEKAYCDEQMSKTEAKKSELEDDVAKLTSTIDTKSAKSAKLKEEVKELQEELASMAKEKQEMDKVRAEQHEAYKQAKADLELGLEGVGKALKVLRKYYESGSSLLQEDQPAKPVFHKKAEGAGGSIIDILEVVESDFAKALSAEESEEMDAQEAYEKRTQEIKVATAEDTKAVEYKVQEFKTLDTEVDELKEDLASTQSELDAVNEYYAEVKDRCIAKPETYEERKARREQEIEGLKEALRILDSETADVKTGGVALLEARSRRSKLHKVLAPF